MEFAQQASQIIFEGIETVDGQHRCTPASLAGLEKVVLDSVAAGQLPAVAREIATVMGFLAAKDGTAAVVDALAALGDKLQGTLRPHVEAAALHHQESNNLRGKDAVKWMGVEGSAAGAPMDGDRRAAILSNDKSSVNALTGSLQRARSQTGALRTNKPRGKKG